MRASAQSLAVVDFDSPTPKNKGCPIFRVLCERWEAMLPEVEVTLVGAKKALINLGCHFERSGIARLSGNSAE